MARVVMVVAMLLVAGRSEAEPLAWTAPATCPGAAEVQARVERRFGGALDEALPAVTIRVWRAPRGYVAKLDAAARGVRTLHSDRCEALADAVAVIVARLANEARARTVVVTEAAFTEAEPPPPTTVAMLDSEEILMPSLDAREPTAIVVGAPRGPQRWGGGLSVLGLSGVGALPSVNIGLEVSAVVRRDHRFVSFGVSRWVPSDARGGGGSVQVKLDTTVLRVGWAPEVLALRAWGLAELGRMAGTGVHLDDERMGSAAWIALGGGFGVAWPMAKHARLVGTFEVAVPLQRARFMLESGGDLYQPAFAAARCALGLEVGWR